MLIKLLASLVVMSVVSAGVAPPQCGGKKNDCQTNECDKAWEWAPCSKSACTRVNDWWWECKGQSQQPQPQQPQSQQPQPQPKCGGKTPGCQTDDCDKAWAACPSDSVCTRTNDWWWDCQPVGTEITFTVTVTGSENMSEEELNSIVKVSAEKAVKNISN